MEVIIAVVQLRSPLVIIDTASGINLTHDRSLLSLITKNFLSPCCHNLSGVGSTDNQKPIWTGIATDQSNGGKYY